MVQQSWLCPQARIPLYILYRTWCHAISITHRIISVPPLNFNYTHAIFMYLVQAWSNYNQRKDYTAEVVYACCTVLCSLPFTCFVMVMVVVITLAVIRPG